ncbi:UDP-phosphate galactose phosphotransferase [Novosphingobium barchaimii LL02]|uniref:UDP-phosphate galactose phosphotransferase n=1 Tax=Novosphingobium barchaimii LL02 TaxID=1114963 RepID=A0A0J8A641_9SPHN|nr:UDP-phosphate galactose phosphotransferase [Novosphingobium barchaimii LL02]
MAPFTIYQNLPSRGGAASVTGTPFITLQPGDEAGLVRSENAAARATSSGRVFDITVAFLAILVFLPFLILAAIAIKLSAPGPVLFVQRRVGCDGRLFPCLKFRSMVVNSQEVLNAVLESSPEARLEWERDQKLRSDPRITPIGAILRKSSLDELPQLFNILAGHMSIVGPRPIIEAEIRRYGPRFNAYCSVRPGLTGLWQVSGRNEVSYEARVRLDALYALRKSLFYDLSICLRTVPAVLASRGVY